MQYSAEQRQQMIAEAKGKVIASLSYDDFSPDPSEHYWVLSFTDGTEMCFRFMSELVR